jgi:phosphohistidine phosphatase
MLLYLMRHAQAEAAGQGGDAARELTPEGREYVRRLLPILQLLRVRPEWIVSSPYRRALQTAQLVAEGLGYEREIVTDVSLSPAGSTVGVQALLVAFAECEQLFFVGHAPSMPTWIGELCQAPQLRFAFPAGAVCCIELPDPRRWSGILRWLFVLEL